MSDPTPGPPGSHGARVPFAITVRDAAHPITKGLPADWMHQGDELYAQLRGPGKNMTVLATALSDPATPAPGRDEPMLMALSFGKGRVFHTTLGHDVNGMSCVGFVTIAAAWRRMGGDRQGHAEGAGDVPDGTTVSYRARSRGDGSEVREGPQPDRRGESQARSFSSELELLPRNGSAEAAATTRRRITDGSIEPMLRRVARRQRPAADRRRCARRRPTRHRGPTGRPAGRGR